MTFEELLNIQAQLNGLAETPPDQVEDIDERLVAALVTECGEALQVIKPTWAWWKRYGKTFEMANKNQILGELADILHFLLTAFLVRERLYVFPIDRDVMEIIYAGSWKEELGEWAPYSHIMRIAVFSTSQDIGVLIRHFVFATRKLGFTREELEQAYRNKAQENIMRFTQTVEARA